MARENTTRESKDIIPLHLDIYDHTHSYMLLRDFFETAKASIEILKRFHEPLNSLCTFHCLFRGWVWSITAGIVRRGSTATSLTRMFWWIDRRYWRRMTPPTQNSHSTVTIYHSMNYIFLWSAMIGRIYFTVPVDYSLECSPVENLSPAVCFVQSTSQPLWRHVLWLADRIVGTRLAGLAILHGFHGISSRPDYCSDFFFLLSLYGLRSKSAFLSLWFLFSSDRITHPSWRI